MGAHAGHVAWRTGGSVAEGSICWVDVMTEVRFERIRENNLKNKGKEQERQKRMLSMLLGSQASLVVKSTFSAWQEMLYNLKKERELERIKFAMNSKNDAHTKKMLGLLMGSQVELLVKSIFSAWSELVTEARKEREMEEMKRSMKAKGAEHTKRMLGMLIGSQDQTL